MMFLKMRHLQWEHFPQNHIMALQTGEAIHIIGHINGVIIFKCILHNGSSCTPYLSTWPSLPSVRCMGRSRSWRLNMRDWIGTRVCSHHPPINALMLFMELLIYFLVFIPLNLLWGLSCYMVFKEVWVHLARPYHKLTNVK